MNEEGEEGEEREGGKAIKENERRGQGSAVMVGRKSVSLQYNTDKMWK